MNQELWYGLGAVIGTAIISLVVWLYTEWQDNRSKSILRKQEADDAKASDSIHRLSDAELDALLKDGPGSGHTKT